MEFNGIKLRKNNEIVSAAVWPPTPAASESGLCSGGIYEASPCADPVLTGPADVSLDKSRPPVGRYGTSPPNNRNAQDNAGPRQKRRPDRRDTNPGQASKHRKPGREATETYLLKMPSDSDSEEESAELDLEFAPMATLSDTEYKDVFAQLNRRFCKSSFRWLAQYKFKIPKKSYMRDHVYPDDRELTEYVAIIKTLIEQREVPRYSVRDERINELASVMEGASEIRHVTIHVSRKHKPDARVLGFIAAVSEFCWILGDPKGATETNRLYREIEETTRKRQVECMKIAKEERKSRQSPKSSVGGSVRRGPPSPSNSQIGSRRGSYAGSP
ncbi:hypothetical protein EDC01DRAFT_305775 [Geopyxis carbonaria]|nr:hypothetical protein EDC01DRAFT_305775 [Geopyxis carbonaria]